MTLNTLNTGNTPLTHKYFPTNNLGVTENLVKEGVAKTLENLGSGYFNMFYLGKQRIVFKKGNQIIIVGDFKGQEISGKLENIDLRYESNENNYSFLFAEIESFQVLSDGYAIDKNYVFFNGITTFIDRENFEFINGFVKDKDYIYQKGKILGKISDFIDLGNGYSKIGKDFFLNGEKSNLIDDFKELNLQIVWEKGLIIYGNNLFAGINLLNLKYDPSTKTLNDGKKYIKIVEGNLEIYEGLQTTDDLGVFNTIKIVPKKLLDERKIIDIVDNKIIELLGIIFGKEIDYSFQKQENMKSFEELDLNFKEFISSMLKINTLIIDETKLSELINDLFNLIKIRYGSVIEIGKIKKSIGIKNVIDKRRWNDLLNSILNKAKNLGFSEMELYLLNILWNTFHDYSLYLEQKDNKELEKKFNKRVGIQEKIDEETKIEIVNYFEKLGKKELRKMIFDDDGLLRESLIILLSKIPYLSRLILDLKLKNRSIDSIFSRLCKKFPNNPINLKLFMSGLGFNIYEIEKLSAKSKKNSAKRNNGKLNSGGYGGISPTIPYYHKGRNGSTYE